jgi:hypothetical protein
LLWVAADYRSLLGQVVIEKIYVKELLLSKDIPTNETAIE